MTSITAGLIISKLYNKVCENNYTFQFSEKFHSFIIQLVYFTRILCVEKRLVLHIKAVVEA